MNIVLVRPDWRKIDKSDKIAIVTRLTLEGYSASQIAAEFSHCTRNAVIGHWGRNPIGDLQRKITRTYASNGSAHGPNRHLAPKRPKPEKVAKPKKLRHASPKTESRVEVIPAPIVEIAELEPVVYSLSEPALVENASILDLTKETCKWPVGDPRDPGFHFCAKPSRGPKPYCGYHARLAFRKAEKQDEVTHG